jgi:hypothetical protein
MTSNNNVFLTVAVIRLSFLPKPLLVWSVFTGNLKILVQQMMSHEDSPMSYVNCPRLETWLSTNMFQNNLFYIVPIQYQLY